MTSSTADDGDAPSAESVTRVGALRSRERIGKFVSVGAAGASLETVIVFVLTGLWTVQPLVAKAVGAEASISLMFLINDRWTFSEEGGTGVVALGRRFVTSHLVRIAGLAVAFATLHGLTSWTDIQLLVAGVRLWPTVANGIGIGVGMVVNYVAESLFTWRIASGDRGA